MNDVTQRKVLGFISLCRRAGRLTTGMDAAVEKAEKGEAHLLLLAHLLRRIYKFTRKFRRKND